MKKWLIIGIVVVLVSLMMAACAKPAPTPSPAPAPKPAPAPTPSPAPKPAPAPAPSPAPKPIAKYPTMKLKAVSMHRAGSFTNQLVEWFVAEIQKRTEGAVTFEPYYGEVLVSGREQLETIQKGVADYGLMLPSYTPGKLPLAYSQYAYPFAPRDPVTATNVWWQLMNEFPAFAKELANNNVKLLYIGSSDDYALLSRTPIRNSDEAKGKKVAQLGGYFADWTKALGITPVSGLTVAERYERLRGGVVDASLLPPNIHSLYKEYEVAKHLVMTRLGAYNALSYVINLDTWKKMTPELQKLFLDTGKEIQDKHAAATREDAKKAIDFMQTQGVTFYGAFSDEVIVKWAAEVPDTPAMMAKSLEAQYPEIWDIARRYLKLAEAAGHKWPREFAVRK